MKKQIVIIIVLILIGVAGFWFLNKKQAPDNFQSKQPPVMGEDIGVLEVGNIVSIFNANDSVDRIMVCESLESCQMPKNGKDNNSSGIVGTIQSINGNDVDLELETGEIKTITLSDDAQVLKNNFNKKFDNKN